MTTKSIVVNGVEYITEAETAAMIGKSQHTLRTARCRPERHSAELQSLQWKKILGRIYYAKAEAAALSQAEVNT